MHPMSFEEFLLSQGVNNDSIDDIRAHVKKMIPFGKGLLETIRTYFRAYILIGGMPECVLRYILGKPDPNDAIDMQADIIDSYRKDILSYAPDRNKITVMRIFDGISENLGRRNKKLVYSAIENRDYTGYREYEKPVMWLKSSRFVNICNNLNEIAHPIKNHIIDGSMKIYLNDTRLLMNMLGRGAMVALNDDISINEGAIAENIVSQMLVSQGLPTYYYELNEKDETRLEIDFVTMFGEEIVAIEVKSGKNIRSASLNKLRTSEHGKHVSRYIKFTDSDISVDEYGVEQYPIFCATFARSMFEKRELTLELPDVAAFHQQNR